jgi:hypothetical protein
VPDADGVHDDEHVGVPEAEYVGERVDVNETVALGVSEGEHVGDAV